LKETRIIFTRQEISNSQHFIICCQSYLFVKADNVSYHSKETWPYDISTLSEKTVDGISIILKIYCIIADRKAHLGRQLKRNQTGKKYRAKTEVTTAAHTGLTVFTKTV